MAFGVGIQGPMTSS